jgi:hypothetical protein
MQHPTEGMVRRLVDEPNGVADADREHIASCPACLSGLAAVLEDPVHSQYVHPERPRSTSTATPRSRWRAALRSPVAAAVGAMALMTGASVAAATDFLQIFRTEQISPVTITQPDLVQLPDLSAYGTVKITKEPRVREVADAVAAEDAAGLSVPQVSELPQGVTGDPTYRVGDKASAVFTFSAEKAAQTAAAAGETLPPPPPGLDGSEFRLVAGPGVATIWPSGQGVPALAVGRAVAPIGYSSGIPFDTARDYVLSLPGLPDDVASQLRSFTGDGTTLPLPVAAEEMTTSTAEVDGAPATVLTSRDGALAAVIWVEAGNVTAVAGSLSADEVLSVARDLRYDR